MHISFFINSFIPLWIILLTQVIFFESDFNQQHYIAIPVLSGLIVIPAIVVYFHIRNLAKKIGSDKVTVVKNKNNTGEYAVYLLAYILAFITDDLFEVRQIVTFGIVFCIFGIIYVRNHMFHINPFIAILGFRLHTASNDADNDVIVLSKKDSLYNSKIRINRLVGGFYIEASSSN